MIPDALADGEVPQQAPIYQKTAHQRRFSLANFIAERGKEIIAATMEFTWGGFKNFLPSFRTIYARLPRGDG
jgi:hypothetical protein